LGDALGDGDDEVDRRVQRLEQRVGGERRRDEDDRGVGVLLAGSPVDGVVDGDPVDLLAGRRRACPCVRR